ncbi:cAMP and cAMP-inhibited cGMP 3',5'-cyclic phosphodiesterase 10A [Papilio machaon]|uniref:3',5'-cyclic-GMP phosphodiesterase n=1 Tax=Papilio machaon TaxID=76193 RepID=A0A194RF41_PAPMA|nr:cAMP and cAMP-inhibited cGMP 3',5'-cyclic phosphodiesterase 10A [Papilio machaon]
MTDPTPRNVRSVKSRLDTINQTEEYALKRMSTMNKVQSHFLVPSEKLDKVTRRVIAPYAQIERKGVKEEEARDSYLDISRFHVFLEDSVDLQALLCDTAAVLKTITDSSGVFVYIVDKLKNEIVLMTKNIKNKERHEVNIPIAAEFSRVSECFVCGAEEGKVAAAHVAATKRHLVLADVQRDRRFAQGLRWVDAKTALCVPVLKPDGDCYAVLELYRTVAEPYDDVRPNPLSSKAPYIADLCASVAWWAGAAAHQAGARATLQRAAHLDLELRALLHDYFCERAALDTMLTDMLAIVKSFIGAMRSSFFIVDRQHMEQQLVADVWEDGWQSERTALPKKKAKVNLSVEQSPAGLVARTGTPLNLHDAFRDPRFLRDVDPATGMVVRSSLTYPIKDKKGVIGVVQLANKSSGRAFDAEDEQIFQVFVDHCALIVHFYHMQQRKLYHENLNRVYSELLGLHLRPCGHDLEELETNSAIVPPFNFKSFNYHISEGSREEMPSLVCLMYSETFAAHKLERRRLADFVLTVLTCYRPNPYHNAEHAFCFTHTMYLILRENPGYFSFVEVTAASPSALCALPRACARK